MSEADLLPILARPLAAAGHSVDTATTGEDAFGLLERTEYQVVICDFDSNDIDGFDLIRRIKNKTLTTQAIALTGHSTVSQAVAAAKAGALYVVPRPFDHMELLSVVEEALKRQQLMTKTGLGTQLSTQLEHFNMVGTSRQMQTIYETIEAVAKSDANVLIVGESGTGKELIADAIHYNSSRSRKPLIKVNCGALPKELLESELFGHAKGAFTGAFAEREGLIQQVAGGSLLLDEITEMSVELQPKFLHALQEGSYRKVGSSKTYAIDFRLISAIEKSADDAIHAGLLREDLFYRISTVTINVPPLRERSEDIKPLAEHFLKTYAEKYERPIKGISPASYRNLLTHTWPGNVRELRNVIERAVVLARGNVIEPADLPFVDYTIPDHGRTMDWDLSSNMTLEEIERRVIEKTLQRVRGNKQAAANILGIPRASLYTKIKKYQLNVGKFVYRDA